MLPMIFIGNSWLETDFYILEALTSSMANIGLMKILIVGVLRSLVLHFLTNNITRNEL